VSCLCSSWFLSKHPDDNIEDLAPMWVVRYLVSRLYDVKIWILMTSHVIKTSKPTVIRLPMAPCKMTPIWRRLIIGFGEFPFTDVASKWAWSVSGENALEPKRLGTKCKLLPQYEPPTSCTVKRLIEPMTPTNTDLVPGQYQRLGLYSRPGFY